MWSRLLISDTNYKAGSLTSGAMKRKGQSLSTQFPFPVKDAPQELQMKHTEDQCNTKFKFSTVEIHKSL